MTDDNIRIMAIYRGAGSTASILYRVNEPDRTVYRTVDLEHDEAAEFIKAIDADPEAEGEYALAIARANEKETNA